MEKQNPFSLYDFLGYLIPGAIVLCGVLTLRGIAVEPNSVGASIVSHFAVFGRVELYVPFIVLVYALGHLLSYGSASTVERFSLWTIGYPSRFLLDGASPEPVKHEWLYGVVVSYLAPLALIDWTARRKGWGDVYAKQLDHEFANAIRKLLNKFAAEKAHLRIKDAYKESDVFRFIYHHVVEHSKSHLIKLQNYVALYGFLRTLTFSSVAFFWVCLGQFAWVIYCVCNDLMPSRALWQWIGLLAAFACLSFVLYLDFVKFSRRFTLEAFMALAVLEK